MKRGKYYFSIASTVCMFYFFVKMQISMCLLFILAFFYCGVEFLHLPRQIPISRKVNNTFLNI